MCRLNSVKSRTKFVVAAAVLSAALQTGEVVPRELLLHGNGVR